MRIILNSKRNEALIERIDGGSFTLSAQNELELRDLLAMWAQPLENWDGTFLTSSELIARSEDTVSLDLKKSA